MGNYGIKLSEKTFNCTLIMLQSMLEYHQQRKGDYNDRE